MNLYLLERTDNVDRDQYTGAVVAAESEEAARLTHPDTSREIMWSDGGWKYRYATCTVWYAGDYTWADPATLKVKLLATDYSEPAGVILTNFWGA